MLYRLGRRSHGLPGGDSLHSFHVVDEPEYILHVHLVLLVLKGLHVASELDVVKARLPLDLLTQALDVAKARVRAQLVVDEFVEVDELLEELRRDVFAHIVGEFLSVGAYDLRHLKLGLLVGLLKQEIEDDGLD